MTLAEQASTDAGDSIANSRLESLVGADGLETILAGADLTAHERATVRSRIGLLTKALASFDVRGSQTDWRSTPRDGDGGGWA